MKRFLSLLFMMATTAVVYAQDQGPADGPKGGLGPELMNMLFMMAIIFGIFYFILIRPQQQQRKKHEERINALKKGDRIIGAGGIYGEIVGMDQDKAVIAVGKDKVKLEILRSTITHILSDEEKKS